MAPRLICSHHLCQELIFFPGIALQMINTVGLAEIQVGVLCHLPYSPDLSPCGYAIFGLLKKALRGKRYTLDDDVKQYVWNWFTTQPREFYETAIHRLVSQWYNSQDQYF